MKSTFAVIKEMVYKNMMFYMTGMRFINFNKIYH